MLTSKQRAILRGKANTMDPVFIGFNGDAQLLLADHLVALRFQNAAQFAELSGVAGSCTNFHAATLLSASTGAGAVLPQSPPG